MLNLQPASPVCVNEQAVNSEKSNTAIHDYNFFSIIYFFWIRFIVFPAISSFIVFPAIFLLHSSIFRSYLDEAFGISPGEVPNSMPPVFLFSPAQSYSYVPVSC